MNRETVSTDAAPKAIGPYVQGIKTNGFLYTSGQIALDPKTGELIKGDIMDQTRQALTNLEAILEAGGSSLERVIKATIFLKSMNDFATVNKIYEEFMGQSKPARSTVAVSDLPKGALVEIDFIALV